MAPVLAIAALAVTLLALSSVVWWRTLLRVQRGLQEVLERKQREAEGAATLRAEFAEVSLRLGELARAVLPASEAVPSRPLDAVERVHAQVNRLRGRSTQADREVSELRRQLGDVQEELAELRRQSGRRLRATGPETVKAHLQVERDNLRGQVQVLTAELGQARSRHEEDLRSLRRELEEARLRLRGANRAITQLDEERTTLMSRAELLAGVAG